MGKEEDKKQTGETPKKKAAFQPAGLRALGAGAWMYRHTEGDGELDLSEFWKPARAFGLKDGDYVIFIVGKTVNHLVV